MYKYIMYAPAVVFALLAVIMPVGVLAQNTGTTGDMQYMQSQPGDTQTPGATQSENRGFDWRWVLPLVAIPLILPFLMKRDRRDEDRDEDTTGAFGQSPRAQATYHDVNRPRKVGK